MQYSIVCLHLHAPMEADAERLCFNSCRMRSLQSSMKRDSLSHGQKQSNQGRNNPELLSGCMNLTFLVPLGGEMQTAPLLQLVLRVSRLAGLLLANFEELSAGRLNKFV